MQRQRLTKKVVDAEGANGRDRIIWDTDLTGFGLRIRRGGSKTFIAQYRAGGGRSGATRRGRRPSASSLPPRKEATRRAPGRPSARR